MRKRLIALFLSAFVLLGFTGCDGGTPSEKKIPADKIGIIQAIREIDGSTAAILLSDGDVVKARTADIWRCSDGSTLYRAKKKEDGRKKYFCKE